MAEHMSRLILIRHAEALGQGRYLGRRTDPSLSEKGRKKAEALGITLSEPESAGGNREILLFSSPMRRTVETAELVFPGAELQMIPEFMEMDFGDWDGMSWQEITAAAGTEYKKWLSDPVHNDPPGGETLTGFNLRVAEGLERVLMRTAGQCAYLVLHAGVIRSILCSVIGLPAERYWSFKIDCASYSEIKIMDNDKTARTAVIEYLNHS